MSAVQTPRAHRAAAGLGWAPILPILLCAVLLLAAGARAWGAGAENAPYLGALVVLVAAWPSWRWYAACRAGMHGSDAVGRVPFLPALGVLYALYFGTPVLFADEFTVPTLRGNSSSLMRALGLAAFGWVALLAGWRFAAAQSKRLPVLRLPIDFDRARGMLPWLLGAGFLAILAQRTLNLPGGLMQPVRFVQTFFQVGVGILALLAFRGELTRRESRFFRLGLIPAYLFLQVGHGSVAQLAYTGIFLLFLAWGSGRKVPLVWLCLLGMAVLVMRGNVHAFRQEAWSARGSQVQAGVWDRSAFFVQLLVERFSSEPANALEESFGEVSARVAHLGTFSHVAALTPERVPYWSGETYAALPTTVVPRILWPDKPSKEIGQAFGHRYELLAPDDRTTAVNLPMLVEFYANFGARGVLGGMFLLGLLYAVLHALCNRPESGGGGLILGSILFSRLILIESDFTLVFGALLQTSVLLWWVLRQLGPRDARGGKPRLGAAPRAPVVVLGGDSR